MFLNISTNLLNTKIEQPSFRLLSETIARSRSKNNKDIVLNYFRKDKQICCWSTYNLAPFVLLFFTLFWDHTWGESHYETTRTKIDAWLHKSRFSAYNAVNKLVVFSLLLRHRSASLPDRRSPSPINGQPHNNDTLCHEGFISANVRRRSLFFLLMSSLFVCSSHWLCLFVSCPNVCTMIAGGYQMRRRRKQHPETTASF